MNHERIKQQKREWALRNKSMVSAYARDYYQRNKASIKARHKAKSAQYRAQRKLTAKTSEHIRIRDNYYSSVRKLINRYKSGCKITNKSPLEKILGCTKLEFMHHLESTLPKGKTLKKAYGLGKYEIDHIIPCSHFDLSKPEDVLKCWHHTNMRLLKASENRSRDRRRIS